MQRLLQFIHLFVYPCCTHRQLGYAQFLSKRKQCHAKRRGPLTKGTLSERNNKHFVEERSGDGIYYSCLATAPDAVIGNVENQCNYTDCGVTAGKWFYGIRQMDVGGTSAWSRVAVVTYDATKLILSL